MKYPVFAIRDFKTGYLAPTCEPNAEAAARNFEHACIRSDSLFFTHPEDYALFRVGEYDSDSGALTGCVPEEVITAPQAIQSALAHSYMKGAVGDGKTSG